ncbi:hypothetical protein EPO33_05085 [Patescibacteria group bacterium]|nr:MAG: hypothetical protein EPO33_05085 [Patescibacteria group bacterium]
MKMIRVVHTWALPAVVFLIPWGARVIFLQPQVDGVTVEALTLSLFAVELLVYVAAAVSVRTVRRRPSSAPRRAEFVLFVLVLWALASALWSPVPALAMQAAVRLLAAALLLYLLARQEDLGRVRDAFLLSAALQAGLGLWQLFAHEIGASTLLGVAAQHAAGPSAVIESAAGRLLRAYGTFPHPNVLGGFLAAALVVALADWRQGRAGIVVSGAVPLIAAGLLASFSRSAWIAAAAGAFVLVAYLRLDHRLWLRLVAVGVVGILFAILVQPYLVARVTADGRLEERSINERKLALIQARGIFLAAPLTGVGIGQTVPALIRAGEPLLEPPHLVPAVVITELGPVGLLLAAAFLLTLFPRGRRVSPEAAALAACAAVLSLFDHYLWTAVPGLLLGALIFALLLDHPRQTP